jgi:undecaprenyl-diphosphatase
VLLVLDRLPLKPRHTNIMDYPLGLCLGIGLFQCLSLIPGASRSGATIAGALLLGTDKRSAAEYSFFLAMPTMAGAFAFDLYKNIDQIDGTGAATIAIGFVVAFISAVIVVRGFLDFVSRHGFAPFAWWRIGVGVVALLVVFLTPAAPDHAYVSLEGPPGLELPGGPEPIEVARQDGFQAGGIDADAGERTTLALGRP